MRTLAAHSVTVRYDDAVLAPRPPLPPAEAMLSCIAADCGRDVEILIVHDARPLLRPGASAFGPGALGAALLDARAQSLVPGARARPTSTVEPLDLRGRRGYLARYALEDRDLATRDLVLVAVPLSTGLLAGEVTGPNVGERDVERLLAVLRTIQPTR